MEKVNWGGAYLISVGVGNSREYRTRIPFVLFIDQYISTVNLISCASGGGQHEGICDKWEKKKDAPFPTYHFGEHPRALLWDRINFDLSRAAHPQGEFAQVRR